MTNTPAGLELDEQIAGVIQAANPIMDASKLDRLERLAMLREARDTAEQLIVAEVAAMRSPRARASVYNSSTWTYSSDRYSWDELGQALGMPKSSAQRKYRDAAPRERHR
jgi:hypothetical protein